MMSLRVTKDGVLTTVQDLGRYGYRRFGVNPSGAMDRTATRLLNLLLQNDENAPVLEFHFPAGEYLFEEAIVFAVGGADFCAKLSGEPVVMWSVQEARAGDLLRFTRKAAGNRAYLAVKEGFKVETWLGSASTNMITSTGGFQGRRLRVGDRLPFEPAGETSYSSAGRIGPSFMLRGSSPSRLRVTAGPEFDALTGISLHEFLTGVYIISPRSDRMGFRLEGPPLYTISDNEMLSSGTTFGTIQLLPDGQLIVLMADHQTTGGYPRIATITSVDLPLIAQLGPGEKVSFDLVNQIEAELLSTKFERDISYLKTGLRVRSGRL